MHSNPQENAVVELIDAKRLAEKLIVSDRRHSAKSEEVKRLAEKMHSNPQENAEVKAKEARERLQVHLPIVGDTIVIGSTRLEFEVTRVLSRGRFQIKLKGEQMKEGEKGKGHEKLQQVSSSNGADGGGVALDKPVSD